MSGHGKNGTILYENDDINTADENYNSRISEALESGDYTIEATTYGDEATGEFALAIEVTTAPTPIPTPTHTPTPTPTATATPEPTPTTPPIPTPTPVPVLDSRIYPDPSTKDFRPRANTSYGAWKSFDIVSSERIKIVANPDGGNIVYIATSGNKPSSNWCLVDDEPDTKRKDLDAGQEFYMAACRGGDAKVGLETTDGRHIYTYEFNTGSAPQPAPTPTTPPVPTPTTPPVPTPTQPAVPTPTTPPVPTPTPDCPSGTSSGNGNFQPASVCPASPPPKPTGLTSTPGDKSITLDWGGTLLAQNYEVQQKKVRRFLPDQWNILPFDDGNERFRVSVDIADSSAVISGLTNGKEYFHRVRVVSGSGESAWSDEIRTGLPAPSPTGLEAQHGQTWRTMKLDWDDVNVAEGYEIQYRVGTSQTSPWRTVPDSNISFSGSSAVVSGLSEGVTYSYKVRVTNDSGKEDLYSNWSGEATRKMMGAHHQEDDVVMYEIVGSMPANFSSAIASALLAWRSAIATIGLDFVICKKGAGNCNSQNTDNHLIK